MSANPLASKMAVPYARALFDFSVENFLMHQITSDFRDLEVLLNESSELTEYLNNPIVSQDAKREILTKLLQPQLNKATFKFLMVLVDRDRISLLQSVVNNYLELVYETAVIKTFEVTTAFDFTDDQKDRLSKKLKEATNARRIRLAFTVEPSLIGGFLIKNKSKVIDFTIKNQLEQLAKHLGVDLELEI